MTEVTSALISGLCIGVLLSSICFRWDLKQKENRELKKELEE